MLMVSQGLIIGGTEILMDCMGSLESVLIALVPSLIKGTVYT